MDVLEEYLTKNLKVIGKIELNSKICIRNGHIYLDNSRVFGYGIKRYIMGDSRTSSIEFIRTLMNTSFVYLNVLIQSKDNDHNTLRIQRLKKDLEDCIIGIQHMKETYADDANFRSSTEVLIDNIKVHISRADICINPHH